MNATVNNDMLNIQSEVIETLKKKWKWFLALGILSIIVGIGAIAAPQIATLTVEVFVGWVLLFAGVIQIIHSFYSQRWGNFFLRAIGGILYLGAGALLLQYPIQGIITLTMLVAVIFFAEGIFKVITAIKIPPMSGKGWLVFSGIVSIALGLLIWAKLPSDAIWAVGLLVGINLIFGGTSMVSMALAVKKQ
jgi:uncharacterized membrane protein HdeD (DUF308 family)